MRFVPGLVVLVSGCATVELPPRYVVESPSAVMPAVSTASAEVTSRLRRDEDVVVRCFDALVERREMRAVTQEVSLEVVVRQGAPMLMHVRARGVDSVVDEGLAGCLSGVVDTWRWPSRTDEDADVVVPLRVTPRSPGKVGARWAPSAASYKPRERTGE